MVTEQKRTVRICTAILLVLVLLTLLPIALLVVSSFMDEKEILNNGYSLFPEKWSVDAYLYMIKQGATIFRAYGISIFVTLVGTVLSTTITTMIAYPMSRKNFRGRNALSFFVFFTMLFNGGVVSSYILWTRYLHVKDTIFALILPNYLVSAFNVILVRNFYTNNIPDSLLEAAQLDGANDFQVFFKIVLPLAVPVISTISLFTALTYWNDWINGLYYINDASFFGIQNFLLRIMNNIQALKSTAANSSMMINVELPSFSVRMALAVIGMLPVLVLFPFVQKHLIRGVVVGAVKG